MDTGGTVVGAELANVELGIVVLAIRATEQAGVGFFVDSVSILCFLDFNHVFIRVNLFPIAVQTPLRTVEALVSPWIVILRSSTLVASIYFGI